MKKTLIALAVTASTAVSGSAMAWEVNGIGGSISLGGTLTPAELVTPWEIKTGSASGLDAVMKKGWKRVDIPVKTAIPVLGIRLVDSKNKTFKGQAGISPQISFGNAIDVDAIQNSEAVLTLDVTDNVSSKKIGTLSAPLLVGAEYSYTGPSGGKFVMVAAKSGDGFFGGLPKNKSGSLPDPYNRLSAISGEFVANYDNQGTSWGKSNGGFGAWNFTGSAYKYSAFYGSGIEQGQNITITLDTPVTGNDGIVWKAALPIMVSYQ